MNHATRLVAIALAILLMGCAHQPKQVEASRPMVNAIDINAQYVLPANVQEALDSLPQGATFIHQHTTFTVGQRYISALGRDCVELLFSYQQGHPQRSAACKSAAQWYQVPQLEQASLGNLFAE